MATIQLKRQLKFAHPKDEAIKYIKTKVKLAAGEPLLCTYKKSNGKWGAIEVICVYPKGTSRYNYAVLMHLTSDELYDNDNKLKENLIKINDDIPEWEHI